TVDRADLDFGEQASTLRETNQKVESGPGMRIPVPEAAGSEDVGCRTAAQINVPRVLSERNPVCELCVQCHQGAAVAHSYFKIWPEIQLFHHGTQSSMAAKVKLLRLGADTGANTETLLSVSGAGRKGCNQHNGN